MTRISEKNITKKTPTLEDTVFGGDTENFGGIVRYDIDALATLINSRNSKSSYQIAVDNGFIGTELQWLQSLKDSNYIKVSAESIPSHTPVAIVNNQAYKLNASNPLHQFAFVGFSENGTSIGQNCRIKQIGEIVLVGWGLTPNQHYLIGANGTLITNNVSNTNFTKVIGYATDSNTLQIIKDSITINK